MSTPVVIVIESQAVDALLRHLELKLSPVGLGGYLKETMEPYLQHAAKERFNSEGGDIGGWLPLSSTTVSIRQSLGYGGAHPVNVRTGQLQEYVTSSQGNVVEIPEGAQLSFPDADAGGTLEQKLRAAQVGLADPVTPARPVLAVTEADLAFFVTSLELFLLEGVMA